MRRSLLLIPALIMPVLSVQAEEKANSPWKGSAELGSIRTTGNTDTSSVNAKFGAGYKGEVWNSGFKVEALTSKEDDITSKEKYNAAIKFDRNFSKHHYLTLLAEYEDDRFSGFEYQSTISAGYGYRAINEQEMELDFEIGPGYRYDRLNEGGEEVDETVLRLAMNFAWTIREGVEFIELLSMDDGADNTIWKSETGLKSQINGSLATKLTYKVKKQSEVPEGTEDTDTEFGVTLVYSF
ncbi:DUF481 domain-containing protein [Thalassolituus marinus]|uniref:DUF481 domain-containing protein n=1 Tax=Thalassolituus marinus TaxID=671053 RepID=A0ABS7ZPD5_9GAMM|nr:DUF481 domain-containing protein [Thalassolituus marinus]MCA6063552.1 DUF481 domain-containing protein [Thalassolituus marinus]